MLYVCSPPSHRDRWAQDFETPTWKFWICFLIAVHSFLFIFQIYSTSYSMKMKTFMNYVFSLSWRWTTKTARTVILMCSSCYTFWVCRTRRWPTYVWPSDTTVEPIALYTIEHLPLWCAVRVIDSAWRQNKFSVRRRVFRFALVSWFQSWKISYSLSNFAS